MDQDNKTILYSWTALEFGRTDRRPAWYLWAILIATALGAYLVYRQDWLRLAVLVMVAITTGLTLRMRPREFEHRLTDQGVGVGKKFYPYKDFSGFAILISPEGAKLVLSPVRKLGPALSLQLGGADVEKIRAVLSEYLEEKEMDEDLLDRMNRALKF